MSGLRLPSPAHEVALRPLDRASSRAGRVHLLGGLLAITAAVLMSGAHLLDAGIPLLVPVLLVAACLCAGYVCLDLLALPSWRRRPLTRPEPDSVALRAHPQGPASRAHRQLSRLHVDGRRLVLTDLTGDQWWLPLDGAQAVRRVAVLVRGTTPTELHLTTANGETLLVLGWAQWFPESDTGPARAFAAAADLEYREGSRREARVRDPGAPTPRADGVSAGSASGGHLIALVAVSCFAPVIALVAASAGAPAPGALRAVGAGALAVVAGCTALTLARLARDRRTS